MTALCESCYGGGAVQTVRATIQKSRTRTDTELLDLCEACYAALFPVRSRIIAGRYLLDPSAYRKDRVRLPYVSKDAT